MRSTGALLLLAGAAREGLAPVARPDCADDPFTAAECDDLLQLYAHLPDMCATHFCTGCAAVGANLAALSHLIPVRGDLAGSHDGQSRADGIPLAHDDAGRPTDLARLRPDAEPVRCPNERHGGFRRRAQHVQ